MTPRGRWLIIGLLFLTACQFCRPAGSLAQQNLPGYMNLMVDGEAVGEVGYLLQDDGGIMLDAKGLLGQVPGAEYYPALSGTGFVAQYGSIISFVARQHDIGMVSCQKVELDYQIREEGGMMLAPLNFLSQALNSDIDFRPQFLEIQVQTKGKPEAMGHGISEAGELARNLSGAFEARQGEITLTNAIDVFDAGYTTDCNGNNAGFPYFVIQAPPSGRTDQYQQAPIAFQLDQDEAIVAVGYTPPEVKYYSYRSYLVNRYYQDTNTRDKIYASLGDTINNYNLAESWGDEVYQHPFMIVSTGNQQVYEQIRDRAVKSGIPEENIFLDIIPADLFNFGLDSSADAFNFLHRASVFANKDEEEAYRNNPTMEIMRVTPRTVQDKATLEQAALQTRGTGVSEQEQDPRLSATLEQLYRAILTKHASGKSATRLDTSVWLEEGNQAIADGTNVLGETRDTLYTWTDTFQFNEDDLIVVFGVNHQKTGKSVYSNVSCYGAEYSNGFGGITNFMYQGSAREYLPDIDPELADMFYVWKFARSDPGDGTTYVVNQDVNHDYTGIDYGDEVFMAYRSYIDLPTTVGTILGEIVRDQAVLIR